MKSFISHGLADQAEDIEDEFLVEGEDIFDSEMLMDSAYSALLNLIPDKYEQVSMDGHGVKTGAEMRDIGSIYVDGIYMPCSERLLFTRTTDFANDGGLNLGSVFMGLDGKYSAVSVAKVPALPRGYVPLCKGEKIKSSLFTNTNDVLDIQTTYVVINKDGDIRHVSRDRAGVTHNASSVSISSAAIGLLADSRTLWTSTAMENLVGNHKTPVRFGMTSEQIKSIFYARSLPLTATGRKRPILHLVRAHERRLKAGVDVDISRHIRGLDCVNIGGMEFNIRPPVESGDLHKRFEK